jgi:Uma2 family endonuclease
MATRTTMSLAEFLKLPEHELDGTHYELDEGQLITLSPSGGRHGFLMVRIAAYLDAVVDPEKFTVVCGDVGYVLDDREDRATVRGADVSIQLIPPDDSPISPGLQHDAPLVAVEIISASNTRKDIQRKVAQYLGAGGQEVWLIYPETEETHVFRAAQPNPEIYPRGKSFRSALGIEVNTNKLFSR